MLSPSLQNKDGPVGTFNADPERIQLFEPEASALQGRRSTVELRARMKMKGLVVNVLFIPLYFPWILFPCFLLRMSIEG